MTLPTLAIFDMDGTLFDSERLFSDKLKIVMAEYGYTLTTENYARTLGRARDDSRILMKEMYGKDYPFDEISDKARQIAAKAASSGELVIKPGIPELLEHFKKNGVISCVASSSTSDYVNKLLLISKLNEYFSFVIGGEQIERSKPEPDIFLAALSTYNRSHSRIEPSNCLVIEDSDAGIEASSRAGIPVVCIPDMKTPPKHLADKCVRVAESAFDLIKIFPGCKSGLCQTKNS